MEERTERKRAKDMAKDMAKYEFYLAGSLEKVFWNRMPQVMEEGERISILRGEIPALQLVYRMLPEAQDEERDIFRCEIKGFPARARLRDVEQIPSAMPVRGRTDDNYLTREPGLFPDLLKPRRDDLIVPVEGQYRAVWIDFPGTKEVEGGIYPVEVALTSEKEEVRLGFTLEVSAQELPPQKLIHTQWFHADCLADYYRAEVFGEFHWQAIEKQIKLAGELGVNMILTPVFTPPLDTAVGGERTTVQLADISYREGLPKAGEMVWPVQKVRGGVHRDPPPLYPVGGEGYAQDHGGDGSGTGKNVRLACSGHRPLLPELSESFSSCIAG